MYFITGKDGFWSNELGWVLDISLATSYAEEETNKYPLPFGDGVSWKFLPFGMTMRDMKKSLEQYPVHDIYSEVPNTLRDALDAHFRVYTPAGLMTVKRSKDVEFPSVAVEVDGNGGVLIEWDSVKKSIRVHVYEPGIDEPIESFDLDYFLNRGQGAKKDVANY